MVLAKMVVARRSARGFDMIGLVEGELSGRKTDIRPDRAIGRSLQRLVGRGIGQAVMDAVHLAPEFDQGRGRKVLQPIRPLLGRICPVGAGG